MTSYQSKKNRATARRRALGKRMSAMLRVPNPTRVNSWVACGYPVPTRLETTHCELCGEPFGMSRSRLDHCHDSNLFRGWLCSRCNTGLGSFGDTADGIRAALRYLERFEESVKSIPESVDAISTLD